MPETETNIEMRGYRYKTIHLNMPVDLRFNTPLNMNQTAPAIRGLLTDMRPGWLFVLLGTQYYGGTKFAVEVEIDGGPVKFNAVVNKVRWYSSVPGLTYGHSMQIVQIEEDALMRIVAYLAKILGGDIALIRQVA